MEYTDNIYTRLSEKCTTVSPSGGDAFGDWFLPSKDELQAMYDELHLFSLGGFIADYYWCSSEYDANNAWTINFVGGASGNAGKTGSTREVRACRSFNSASSYSLGDTGPAGGLIFWKNVNDYLEAAPSDIAPADNLWSNITLLIGTTGTAVGTGQSNTNAIINQVGHTDSAAKLCDDLII